MFRNFHATEIIIPIIVVIIYSMIVSPTSLLGAFLVFLVAQMIVRGIRYSSRS